MTRPSAFGPGDRYAVVTELGEGGMGTLYLAEDRVLGRRVAVKVIRDDQVAEPQAHARFRREAQALAAVRHPGLVAVYEVEADASPPYLVMEYLEGEDLEHRALRGLRLAPDEGRRALRELADALAHLHGLRILHRDLKPANVFLDSSGRFRLVDFGLAKPLDLTRLTAAGLFVGTPRFLPPEVAGGGDHGPAGDVYQLGLVLWSAFAAREPYAEARSFLDLVARAAKGLDDAGWREAALPPDLEAVVRACCAVEPARRPADGSALRRLVERALGHGDPRPTAFTVAVTPGAPAPPAQASVRRRGPRAVAAALALAVGVLGLLAWRRPTATPGPQPRPLGAALRSLVLLPDALYAAGPTEALRRPRLGLRSPDGATRMVELSPVEGQPAAWVTGLPREAALEATLLDGEVVVARGPLRLPPEVLRAPVVGRFGADRFRLAWGLHGDAPLDLMWHRPADGAPRRTSGRGSVMVEAPPGPVAWRLELGGTVLASGQGTVGLSTRYHPSKEVLALGAGTPEGLQLRGPLTVTGEGLLLAYGDTVLVSVQPLPTASGTVLVERWFGAPAGAGGPGAVVSVGGVVPLDDGAHLVVGSTALGGGAARRLAPGGRAATAGFALAAAPGAFLWARLPDRRILFAAGYRARAGEAPPGARTAAALVDASGGTLLDTAFVDGGALLDLVPVGPGALVLTALDLRHGRVTLLAPSADGRLLATWATELESMGPERLDRGPAGAAAAAPDGSSCFVAFGTTTVLLEMEPGLAGARRRPVPLPLPPEAVPCTAQPWDQGTYALGSLVSLGSAEFLRLVSAGAGIGTYPHVLVIDARTGAATGGRVGQPLLKQRRHNRRWGLLRRGGLVYAAIGYQVFVFRDAPGLPLLHEFSTEATQHAPVALGDAVFVASTDTDVLGLDVVSAPGP